MAHPQQVESEQLDTTALRVALGILLGLGFAYWLWYGSTMRTLTGDDIISVAAARGIVEHGFPELPSGYLYHRGYLTNYLIAASILILGENQLALVLPSALLGIGSLLLAYLLARDVMGRPGVGLAAVVLLLALEFQSFAATSPRMYMGLQFLTMLIIYGAWRGYVEGDTSFQWITGLAFLLAVFQHRQSGALLVAIPVAIMLARHMRGPAGPPIQAARAVGTLVLAGGAYVFVDQGGLPNSLPAIAAGGFGAVQGGLSLNPIEWFAPDLWISHAGRLETALPFAVTLFPLMALVSFKAFQERSGERNQGFLYALVVFAMCAMANLFVLKTPHSRFWLFVIPTYTVLLVTAVVEAIKWLGPRSPARRRTLVFMSLAAGFVPVVLAYSISYGPDAYVLRVARAFGPPCLDPRPAAHMVDQRCPKRLEDSYSNLQERITGDDIVISTNPWLTNFYLGRLDGWFRENRTGEGTFTAFDAATDEYYGVPLIDTGDELLRLRDSLSRVFVITDVKVRAYSSPEMLDLLESEFTTYLTDEFMTVYVSAPGGNPEPAGSQ